MAKFFQRQSLFTPKYHETEVSGETLRFYPLSLNMLWKMRTAAEPLVKAFKTLTAGKNDVERLVDEGYDDEGNKRTITRIGEVNIELAKMREEKSDAAVKDAMDALFGEDTRLLLGELITDSLRDDFTRDEAVDREVIGQVVDMLNLESIGGMAVGLINANAKVFGPFAEKARMAANLKMNEVLGNPGQTPSQDEAQRVGRDPELSLSNEN